MPNRSVSFIPSGLGKKKAEAFRIEIDFTDFARATQAAKEFYKGIRGLAKSYGVGLRQIQQTNIGLAESMQQLKLEGRDLSTRIAELDKVMRQVSSGGFGSLSRSAREALLNLDSTTEAVNRLKEAIQRGRISDLMSPSALRTQAAEQYLRGDITRGAYRRAIGQEGFLPNLRRTLVVTGAIYAFQRILTDIAKKFQRLLEYAISYNDEVRQTTALFTGVTRSIEKAGRLTQYVAEVAEQMGLSFEQARDATITMLPVMARLDATIDQLPDFIDLQRRLATLNIGPTGGAKGAGIALAELAAGQFRSLQMRFNIPSSVIRQIMSELGTSDPFEALDEYLNRLGITSEVAAAQLDTVSQALTIAESNTRKFLAAALDPVIQRIPDLVDVFVDFLDRAETAITTFREARSALGGEGPQTIRERNPITAALLESVGRVDLAESTLGEAIKSLGETLAQAASLAYAGWSRLRAAVKAIEASFVSLYSEGLKNIAKLLEVVSALAKRLGQTNLSETLGSIAESFYTGAEGLDVLAENLSARAESMWSAGDSFILAVDAFINRVQGAATDVSDIEIPDLSEDFWGSEEVLRSWVEFQNDLADAEEEGEQRILDSEQQYQDQRTELIKRGQEPFSTLSG